VSDNHGLTDGLIFTCEFGSVTLDTPLAQQPALQEFLNVTTSQEGSLVSDELLLRLLKISKCVIDQDLANSSSEEALVELYLGYELWKELPLGADHHDRKPEDLEESGWVNLSENATGSTPQYLSTTDLPPIIEQLIWTCQEETLRRISPELLIGKSLYVLICGATESSGASFSAVSPHTIGVTSCGCITINGQRRGRKEEIRNGHKLCIGKC
jgi:hypothetical protein